MSHFCVRHQPHSEFLSVIVSKWDQAEEDSKGQSADGWILFWFHLKTFPILVGTALRF